MTYKLKSSINKDISLHIGNGVFLDIPANGYFVLDIEDNKAPIELKVILFKYFQVGTFNDSHQLLMSYLKSLKPSLDRYLKREDWKVYGTADINNKEELKAPTIEASSAEEPKRRRRRHQEVESN